MANDYIKLWVKDYRALLEPFNEAERGRILWAMMDYKETGSEPKFLGNERFVWAAIKAKIEAHAKEFNNGKEIQSVKNRKKKKSKKNPLLCFFPVSNVICFLISFAFAINKPPIFEQ